jgi:hypothetical protein
MITTVLRGLGIGIAVAGLADPAWTRSANVTHPLAIVVVDAKRDDSSVVSSRLWAATDRLRSALDADYSVSVRTYARETSGSACPGRGGCVVVSDGATPLNLSTGAGVIGGLEVSPDTDEQIAIERIDRPDRVNANAAGRLNVWLRGPDAGRSVVIQVFDQDMLVGERESASSNAPIALDWVPVTAGPRKLRVVAGERTGTRLIPHDHADVGVEVDTEPLSVLIYEPEPNWLGTFVRRSLEADPRFSVDARSRFGPRVMVGSPAGRALNSEALTGTRTAIISAPNALSSEDVDLIERFVSIRGGSVVLLPDRRPAGPATRLMPEIVAERQGTEVQKAGSLTATELLTFDTSAEGTAVYARAGDHPVIVSRAIGRGRVIVSGALDAWRFRDASFTRYWSALIADAALAAGPSLRLSLERAAIRPGEQTRLTVEWRTMDPVPERVTVSAQQSCDDGSVTPIRLWPGGQPREFTGSVHGTSPSKCVVDAAIVQPERLEASTSLVVASDVTPLTASRGAFTSAILAHGGVIAAEGSEQSLVDRVRDQLPLQQGVRETRPMRSPWWIAPFAACLGGEWWLRRRRGLR